MKEFRIVLGVEIGANFLRAVEVEHRDGVFFLSHAAQRTVESLQVDNLVDKISHLVSEEAILSRVASIAIDSTLMERDTIDIDSDLPAQSVSEILKAEVDFHNDFNGKEYRPAYEVIKTHAEGFNEVFYAAIDKQLLDALRNSFTRCGLSIEFIDIDHGCSEVMAHKLGPRSKASIVVTVKANQVEATFLRNGERLAYRRISYTGEAFYFVTKIAQDLETIADENAEQIYVTGPSVDRFLIDLLQKNVDERYELLVPTERLQILPAADGNSEFKSLPHHYSSAIGAALK